MFSFLFKKKSISTPIPPIPPTEYVIECHPLEWPEKYNEFINTFINTYNKYSVTKYYYTKNIIHQGNFHYITTSYFTIDD